MADFKFKKSGLFAAGVLFCTAGPKSCKDHFIKLLSGHMAYRIIIQFYCADAFCAACHAIHILSADSTDGFQRIYHTVYCSYTDLRIQCGSPVIDFLTTGALSLQDNVQKNLSLSGDAEPLLLQFLYNKIPLHLCMSVASCFFLFCFRQFLVILTKKRKGIFRHFVKTTVSYVQVHETLYGIQAESSICKKVQRSYLQLT